ncbi:MAG TPA: ABC-F family ATP-binding cassette domain-containing protein, partial [Thermodesulfobacteriota bacterium]
MIQLTDISLSFGSREIFKNLSWHIKGGKRIGLFGPNGVGKTTLLNMIAGVVAPERGSVSIPPSHTIGYLPQEVEDTSSDKSVIEEALSAFKDVNNLEGELESLTQKLSEIGETNSDRYKKTLLRLDAIHNELRTRDSHTLKYQSEKLLMGLGFQDSDLTKPLTTFSGGWRMRVALAKLLLLKPNVLLLDEPTNHLDIESIDWLEDYLGSFQGSVIMVSHDRYFLDRMVDSIAELDLGQITEYSGNYSSYLNERSARLAMQELAFKNQQRKIRETERFIERFRYKNTKARQVQSRIKMLEKLERIPGPASDNASIHFKFPEPERSGKVVVELTQFSKSYKNKDGRGIEVFSDAGPLSILRGDKIALIGKNGAGKSTLARILQGVEPFSGERKVGHNVELTFFAQDQAESLSPRNTIIEELEAEPTSQNETEIRSLLGAFLFSGEEVYKTIRVLSGGEKSRVALAKTLLSPKNFMILDEPTNHLDIKSRNVLVDALKQYKGTFLVVSHDRHFLDQVANKIWYADKRNIITYPGTYSEFHYHEKLSEKETSEISSDKRRGEIGGNGKREPEAGGRNIRPMGNKREEAQKRNRLYKQLKERGIENMENWRELSLKQLKAALDALEETIHNSEKRRQELEEFLADAR